MRRGHSQRLCRVVAGRFHGAVRVALEVEHTIGQHPRLCQLLSDPVRDRAEVFSNHEGLGSNALQCHNCQEVFKGVLHIGAFGCRPPTWNPKETAECHDMI